MTTVLQNLLLQGLSNWGINMNYRQWKKNYKKIHGYNPPLKDDKRKQAKVIRKNLNDISYYDFGNAVNGFKQLYDAFAPFLGNNIIDEKEQEALDGFQMLSNSRNDNSLSCVFNFEDKKYPLIGNIDKTFLKTSKDNFVSQVYMLCKVKKKIEKGNSICLDEIFEDVKSMAINREQRRQISKKNMSNPKEIKDKIMGPAFVVIPIAIYQ